MGSLMLAGAAGGLGKGMVENATYSRAQADKDAERQHIMQLDRQRNRAATEAADTQFGRDQQLAETRYGHEVQLQDKGFQQDLAGQNIDASNTDLSREDTQAHDLEMQRLKNKGVLDASGNAGTRSRDKWTTTQQPAGFDENGKAMYDYIAERNGIQYRQVGDKYVEVGLPSGSPEPETFGGDKTTQRRAEKELMDGILTPDEFKDNFFYIPRKYIDRESTPTGAADSSVTAATPLSGELEEIFIQAGTLHEGVDTPMLKAVASIESSFDPMSTSDKGAEGIMQFMPDTADEYGLTDSFDPGQAIPTAAAYLNDSLQKFGGNEMKAIASYNAGRKGVQNAIDKGGEQWVSSLPKETIEYLAKYAAAKAEYMQGGNLVAQQTPTPAPVSNAVPAGPLLTAAANADPNAPGNAPPRTQRPPPDYGVAGNVVGAVGSSASSAGGDMLTGGESAVGALSEAARKTKEAMFGTSE